MRRRSPACSAATQLSGPDVVTFRQCGVVDGKPASERLPGLARGPPLELSRWARERFAAVGRPGSVDVVPLDPSDLESRSGAFSGTPSPSDGALAHPRLAPVRAVGIEAADNAIPTPDTPAVPPTVARRRNGPHPPGRAPHRSAHPLPRRWRRPYRQAHRGVVAKTRWGSLWRSRAACGGRQGGLPPSGGGVPVAHSASSLLEQMRTSSRQLQGCLRMVRHCAGRRRRSARRGAAPASFGGVLAEQTWTRPATQEPRFSRVTRASRTAAGPGSAPPLRRRGASPTEWVSRGRRGRAGALAAP